jgi:hypothetical protein
MRRNTADNLPADECRQTDLNKYKIHRFKRPFYVGIRWFKWRYLKRKSQRCSEFPPSLQIQQFRQSPENNGYRTHRARSPPFLGPGWDIFVCHLFPFSRSVGACRSHGILLRHPSRAHSTAVTEGFLGLKTWHPNMSLPLVYRPLGTWAQTYGFSVLFLYSWNDTSSCPNSSRNLYYF